MSLMLLNDDDTITITDADLNDDGDPATVYTLRVTSPQTVKHLRAAATKKRPNGQTMVDVFDQEKFGESLYDHALASWTGVTYKGKPIGADDVIDTPSGPIKARHRLDSMRKAGIVERSSGVVVVA